MNGDLFAIECKGVLLVISHFVLNLGLPPIGVVIQNLKTKDLERISLERSNKTGYLLEKETVLFFLASDLQQEIHAFALGGKLQAVDYDFLACDLIDDAHFPLLGVSWRFLKKGNVLLS